MNPEELKDKACSMCGNVYCEDEYTSYDHDYQDCNDCSDDE